MGPLSFGRETRMLIRPIITTTTLLAIATLFYLTLVGTVTI